MPEQWAWKSTNRRSAGLLYEPGNWGDILKGEWACRIVDHLLQRDMSFAYLDPFAGQPTYPLSPEVARRMAGLSRLRLHSLAAPFLARHEWPSAASLARSLAGDAALFRVSDGNAERREANGAAGFQVVEQDNGWDILQRNDLQPGQGGLVLIDPYDFLAEWSERLSVVLNCARTSSMLVYIYNRSARGPERLRAYRDFRSRLDDALADRPRLIARVPSDGFLPRAHHEMLFIPSPTVAGAESLSALFASLRDSAFAIDEAVRRWGVVEG